MWKARRLHAGRVLPGASVVTPRRWTGRCLARCVLTPCHHQRAIGGGDPPGRLLGKVVKGSSQPALREGRVPSSRGDPATAPSASVSVPARGGASRSEAGCRQSRPYQGRVARPQPDASRKAGSRARLLSYGAPLGPQRVAPQSTGASTTAASFMPGSTMSGSLDHAYGGSPGMPPANSTM